MIKCKCAKDDNNTLKYYLPTYYILYINIPPYRLSARRRSIRLSLNYLLDASVVDLVVPSDS